MGVCGLSILLGLFFRSKESLDRMEKARIKVGASSRKS
jgi:hypothetical protein